MPANQKYLRKDRLDLFLNPRSVAIVGATRKSGPGELQPDRKPAGLRLRRGRSFPSIHRPRRFLA